MQTLDLEVVAPLGVHVAPPPETREERERVTSPVGGEQSASTADVGQRQRHSIGVVQKGGHVDHQFHGQRPRRRGGVAVFHGRDATAGPVCAVALSAPVSRRRRPKNKSNGPPSTGLDWPYWVFLYRVLRETHARSTVGRGNENPTIRRGRVQ